MGFPAPVVKVLKRILKMPRPEKSNTYGMPSTRGTELGFLLACAFLLAPGLTVEAKALMAFAVLMCLYLKWNTGQHSVNQLVTGCIARRVHWICPC